jgi:hypothetical protein
MIVDIANAKRGLCDLKTDTWCRTNLYTKKGTPDEGDALFSEMMTFLGEPWEVNEPGRVDVKDGFIYKGIARHRKQLEVEPGDRFSVQPPDAYVKFTSADSAVYGPYRALGGELPDEDAPVNYTGIGAENTSIKLTDEERQMLEELGYLQEEG